MQWGGLRRLDPGARAYWQARTRFWPSGLQGRLHREYRVAAQFPLVMLPERVGGLDKEEEDRY